MGPTKPLLTFSRRKLGALSVSGVAALAMPRAVQAAPADVDQSITATFGNAPIQDGRIALTVPKLAESGNSVPITVAVESPMTEADHVTRIAVFAEQNPLPKIVEAHLSPASGVAVMETNIRLSGTQGVVAVAEMSDGSLWRARHEIKVVVGACTVLPARY